MLEGLRDERLSRRFVTAIRFRKTFITAGGMLEKYWVAIRAIEIHRCVPNLREVHLLKPREQQSLKLNLFFHDSYNLSPYNNWLFDSLMD